VDKELKEKQHGKGKKEKRRVFGVIKRNWTTCMWSQAKPLSNSLQLVIEIMTICVNT
jgi:hypothetical protein